MQAERDQLMNDAFVRRKTCEERGVPWGGVVDLRWGIADEDRIDGRALPICFAEIDSCRPYFVGLLGHRYGG